MRRFNFLVVILVAILVASSLLVITERAEAEMDTRARFVGVDGLRSATGGGFSGVPVGGRSASYAGQGFHGVRRTPGGVPSVTLSGINAMVRASGNIVIPVELLEFEIE